MTGREKFKVETYFTILDRLKSELEKRCAAYNDYFEKFDFLVNFNKLSSEDIILKANELQRFYHADLEKSFSF